RSGVVHDGGRSRPLVARRRSLRTGSQREAVAREGAPRGRLGRGPGRAAPLPCVKVTGRDAQPSSTARWKETARGSSSVIAEPPRVAEHPELDDVAAEEERGRPVDDDP